MLSDAPTIEARIPELSDIAIQAMFSEMQAKGYHCISNYLAAADLRHLQEFVADAVSRSQQEYVVLKGRETVAGTALEQLSTSPVFHSIFSRLYALATGQAAPPVRFYQILRCLTGKGSARNSLVFHYDSYLITALIPVTIPQSGMRGDFLLLPNTRNIRKSYLTNLLDKVLLDNRLTQSVLRRLTRSRSTFVTRINMIPGNLYLFWGYRSVHTNEPCDPQSVRATALFHFFDPHADSALKRRLKS
jgi:hypothetical protein